LLSCALFGDARASSWRRLTIAEQAAKADAVVEGTVDRLDLLTLDDGFVVTEVRISVTTVLRGSIPTRKVTLRLPGAHVDGSWYGALGAEPDIAPGDTLLVLGIAISPEDLGMVAGPQSVFKLKTNSIGSTIVVDYEGNPVIDPGCTQDRLIARPATEAPSLKTPADAGDVADKAAIVPQDAADVVPVVPGDRVFVDDPDLEALGWDLLMDTVSSCVDAQPASLGASSDIGGGW